MKDTVQKRLRRAGLALFAILAGGSTLQTCETRLRDAITTGTRGYISTLLDPTNLIGVILGTDTSTTGP